MMNTKIKINAGSALAIWLCIGWASPGFGQRAMPHFAPTLPQAPKSEAKGPKPRSNQGASLVEIVSPMPGEKILGAVSISLCIMAKADLSTLTVRLNGSAISQIFVEGSSKTCGTGGRSRTAQVSTESGLRGGDNLLIASIRDQNKNGAEQLTHFDWAAGFQDSNLPYFPPSVSFQADSQETFVNINGVSYPQGNSCTATYQTLVLNRSTLAQNAFQCHNTSADLKNYLGGLAANQLVVVATQPGRTAVAGLDTTSIGGTDYTNVPTGAYPYGYLIVGVSGANAGTATENYYVTTTPNAPFQYYPFLAGTLAVDGSNNYTFHSSDSWVFDVKPNDSVAGTSSVTIGSQFYTAPTGSNGFWLLVLDRMGAQSIDSNWNGGTACQYSANQNLSTCGTFYPTGDTDSATASQAQSELATALSSQSPRNLIILVSVGQPLYSTNGVQPSLVNAIDGLGASDLFFTCGDHSCWPSGGEKSTFTLITSTDPAFSKLLNGKTVFSSNIYTNQKQTGRVRGLVTRGLNSLMTPELYSQETTNGDGADYSFAQVAWAFPAEWPLTGPHATSAEAAAYHKLSQELIKKYITGASGDHLDDIRFYYYGKLNQNLINGTPKADDPYWSYPGGTDFTAVEWAEAQEQIATELGYLANCVNQFGSNGIGGAISDNKTNMALSLTQAAANVIASDLQPATSANVGVNASNLLNLGAGLFAVGDSALPGLGFLSNVMWAGSAALSTFDSNNAIASAEYQAVQTISVLAGNANTYLNNITDGYHLVIDNFYTDWYKLQTAGNLIANTSSTWYIPTNVYTDDYSQAAQLNAQRSLTWQLLNSKYKRDAWMNQQASQAIKIGSWKIYPYSCGSDGCEFSCSAFYADSKMPVSASFSQPVVQSSNYNIYVLSEGIKNNQNYNVSETYPSGDALTLLFGTQGSSLSLPSDFPFVPASPVQTQTGGSYSTDFCSAIGSTKFVK